MVVLFGATGDLTRRKLLPGCRIIGVSLDERDAEGFRNAARSALDEFGARKISAPDGAALADSLDDVPLGASAGALKAAVVRA